VSAAWVIARSTLRECFRRRVFIVVPIASFAFLALYTLAAHFAFKFATGTVQQGGGAGFVDARSFTGATLMGLSSFATLFLASVVAVFLTFASVRGDAEQGLLQPLVVRPVGRSALLLGRFIGAAIVCVSYAFVLYSVSMLITGTIGGWWPHPWIVPALDLAGAVVVVSAISLLGSIFLTTIANGIAVMMIYGAGLVAGLIGQIGHAIGSDSLVEVGKVASWALPFEALYQWGLSSLGSSTSGVTHVIVQLGPLGGAQSGGVLLALWCAAYLALLAGLMHVTFARRDL
jgi:ABC-type transport system involved in multi-copper enzyme maturation permease subunit